MPMPMSDDLKRVVVWENLLLNGTDHCALLHTTEGWLLKGTVVGGGSKTTAGNLRSSLRREVAHSSGSNRAHNRNGCQFSESDRGEQGIMAQFRLRIARMHGCEDVDLALTPATNTLPIRRLDLPIGVLNQL